MDPVYIIRDAAFGRDFTPKLFMALVALGLALWDARRQRRPDYLWVLLFGTVLWGGAEALLRFQGIRAMPERVLFGSELADVPAYVLQGMGEGGLVAVAGLFVGDRWLHRHRSGTILGAVFLVLVVLSTVRSRRIVTGFGEAASRRNVLDGRALVFVVLLVVIGAVFLWRYRAWRPRALAMLVVMILIGGTWTVTQTIIRGRWVEVAGSTPGTFDEAGRWISVLALAFDIVFEIATAYLPFLALPVMLGLVRDPRPLPRSADALPGQAAKPSAPQADESAAPQPG